MTTFYDRYPYFAQYEPEAYAEYSQEMVRKLNDWDLKVYMDMVADKALAIARGENVPMHQTQYLTLEEAMDPANAKANLAACAEQVFRLL